MSERIPMVERAIANANDDYLADTDEDELAAYFISICRLDHLALDWSRISRVSAHTTSHGPGQRHLTVRFSVPFTGPVQLLRLKPKRFSLVAPVADQVFTDTLEVVVEAAIDVPGHAVTLLDAMLDKIEDPYLRTVREQVDEYNREVARIIARELPAARRQILQAREAIKALPYPLLRRPDADAYTVPVTRRSIRPAPPVQPPCSSRRRF